MISNNNRDLCCSNKPYDPGQPAGCNGTIVNCPRPPCSDSSGNLSLLWSVRLVIKITYYRSMFVYFDTFLILHIIGSLARQSTVEYETTATTDYHPSYGMNSNTSL